jgi:hypothetical protein
MQGFPAELRLLLNVLLNAAVFAGAYRFARRRGDSGILQAACDAFLVWFVVQYAAVALTGVVGAFNVVTMSIVGFAAAAALWFAAGPAKPTHDEPPLGGGRIALLVGGAFVTAYVLSVAYDQRFNPPMATDPLVYHLPTAVQWIQTGRLGLFPTWYWNPAATYSPATTSTFMAWLMAPMGNDVLARFVQVPALVFIYLLTARICQLLGCGRAVAALIGVAAAMSRPLFSEAIIAKDDLFVTAFFAAAVVALAPANLRGRLGPWRVGVALGMTLACKYTVLLACPLLVFLVDAPFRAGWIINRSRRATPCAFSNVGDVMQDAQGVALRLLAPSRASWLTAIATGLVLFAPWYVRNIVLTGNPLFPVDVKPFGVALFEGLFSTERDQQLRTAGGVWRMLGQTYHSLPAVLVAVLGVGWLAALVGAGRTAWRDPLTRACTIGSVVTVAIFLVTSPHHEVRYMFPIFVLWFGVTALAITRWVPSKRVQIGLGAIIAVASVVTGFESELARRVFSLLAPAAIVTVLFAAGLLLCERIRRRPDSMKLVALSATAAGLAVCAFAYVFWSAYLEQLYEKDPDRRGRAGIPYAWHTTYAREAPLWSFVRENLLDDARIAVANTYYVYPFFDAAYQRRVDYAPVLRGLHDFWHLPRLGDTVPGDVIVERMTRVMNAEPDKQTWLANLRAMDAQYLVVATIAEEPNPPEAQFVAEDPARFEPLFTHREAGSVYRITDLSDRPATPATTSPAPVRQ